MATLMGQESESLGKTVSKQDAHGTASLSGRNPGTPSCSHAVVRVVKQSAGVGEA